jgi:hypothetical protein
MFARSQVSVQQFVGGPRRGCKGVSYDACSIRILPGVSCPAPSPKRVTALTRLRLSSFCARVLLA